MVKKVGYSYYCHISNIKELCDLIKDGELEFYDFLLRIQNDYEFNIVKYNNGSVTLIYSPDWDSSNEPLVGDCYLWKDNSWKNHSSLPQVSKNYKQVYHNKWQFVQENYDGFDVELAKERTNLWNSIPNIKEHKTRIGYKDYWEKLLKDNNIPI